jgi:hypothetical protein
MKAGIIPEFNRFAGNARTERQNGNSPKHVGKPGKNDDGKE